MNDLSETQEKLHESGLALMKHLAGRPDQPTWCIASPRCPAWALGVCDDYLDEDDEPAFSAQRFLLAAQHVLECKTLGHILGETSIGVVESYELLLLDVDEGGLDKAGWIAGAMLGRTSARIRRLSLPPGLFDWAGEHLSGPPEDDELSVLPHQAFYRVDAMP